MTRQHDGVQLRAVRQSNAELSAGPIKPRIAKRIQVEPLSLGCRHRGQLSNYEWAAGIVRQARATLE